MLVFYLYINEIVEWVDVLLYQTFHLQNTQRDIHVYSPK